MSNLTLNDSLWLLARTRGAAIIVRLVILVSPILATFCTAAAAGRLFLIGTAVITVLAALCAVFPDTHVGLIVVAALAVEWIIRVDNPVPAWSIGLAALLGVFHVALACASVAPGGAVLMRSLYAAWIRHGVLALSPIVAVWATTVALGHVELGRQALLVAAALVGLAVAGYSSASAARSRTD
jgi:hypothetical protein